VSHDKSALAQSQAKFATLEAQARPLKAAEALTAGRVAAAQSITGATMNWDKALGDFARVMPTNSSLSSLNLTAAPAIAPPPPTTTDTSSTSSSSSSSSTTTTAAPAPTGGQLTIGGTAPNTNGVALVLDRLALLPWLQGVTLSSASRQPDGSNTFNIVAAASQER
jgi:hypothetical protein